MPKIKKDRKKFLNLLTKQHIENAVARIITRDGVLRLTMDKIAEEAGVAKGTLYLHFETKNQLLQATMDSCFERLTENLFEILDSDLAPDVRLKQMINRHMSFFDENRDFFRVLLYERNLAQTKKPRHGSSRYQAFVEKIAEVVKQGIRSGHFRPVDSAKVAAMIAETTIALIRLRLICSNPDPVEKDTCLLSSFILRGIGMQGTSPGERT
ncbi:MAG TPA: TetR/AcrR family transcriptional regulator [archaeon]|nr:TetR/AcrR family transcriptional regulator [archaeon]